MNASICICTYNGAKRIGGVLEALAKQQGPPIGWEALVINNASTDETSEIVRRFFAENSVNGRMVQESQPGLSFARSRAAREAKGEIICFLDDDNIPSRDFVGSVMDAFDKFPKAGVIGGKVLPRWEIEPTPLARAVASFALAICDEGDIPKQNNAIGGGVVGAGLCIRRDLLCEIFSDSGLAGAVTDRVGSSLIGGGDLAISVMARTKGWECWYVPSLKIEHVLPSGRMQKGYLLNLYEGIGRGQAAVRRIFDPKARSPLALGIAVKDAVRLIKGRIFGPVSSNGTSDPCLVRDLHDLHLRMIWGRLKETPPWWR